MPPAAPQFDFPSVIEEQPYNSTEDVGEIEVEALLEQGVRVVARIRMLPQQQSAYPPLDSDPRYAYFQKDKCLADSFDSLDEIPESSNEARLLQTIAKKSTVLSYNLNGGLSFDEDAEKYLDVLDKHLEETDPEMTSFDDLDHGPDDLHPRKTRPTMDQMMETFLDSACCECDAMSVGEAPLKPAIRPSRWTHGSKRDASFRHSDEHVQFKEVDIREFKMTLGNHPSATSGPPVMIDWNTTPAQKKMSLEDYERARQPRRNRRQLKLSLQQRHNILVKERGHSFEEVKEAWRQALEIRKQRKETLERGLALMKWDEVWESTCRKFTRIVDG